MQGHGTSIYGHATAIYIESQLKELAAMARRTRMETLSYMIDVAALEAATLTARRPLRKPEKLLEPESGH
jgi:hypothetical protein